MKARDFVLVDFEYRHTPGNLPTPVCMVAFCTDSKLEHRVWFENAGGSVGPPVDFRKYTLVAYYALAELSCFHTLGWELPEEVIDLYVEFKNIVNGTRFDRSLSLLGCLRFFDIQGMEYAEKEEMRNLILNQVQYSETEKEKILNYCASDVYALQKIIGKFIL